MYTVAKEKQHIKVTKEDLAARHLGHMLVNTKLKIALCPIEKIASSQFRQMFFRMEGDENWFEPPYHKKPMESFQRMSRDVVSRIMHDDSFIKAVVFRDPALRLLSSYLHLVKSPDAIARYRTYLTDRHKGTTWTDYWTSIIVDKDQYKNIHWDPQTDFCGLKKFWPLFNFVGNFEHLKEHSTALSTLAGLTNYTDKDWSLTRAIRHPLGSMGKEQRLKIMKETLDKDKKMKLKAKKRPDNKKAQYLLNDCMICSNHAVNRANYSKFQLHTEYITKEVWTAIRNSKFYRKDYEIFAKIKDAGPFDFRLYDTYQYDV